MKKLSIIFLAGFLSLILMVNPAFAARYDFGKPGIYNLTPFTLSDGEGSGLSTDNHGNIILSPSSTISLSASSTVTVTTASPTSTTLTYIFTNASSTTNIKATAGRFHGMFVDNATSTKLYVQFFDTSTTTISGAVPLLTYAINGGNQMITDASYFQYLQKYFSSGIAIGISTSFKTFTPSADFGSVNIMVEYD